MHHRVLLIVLALFLCTVFLEACPPVRQPSGDDDDSGTTDDGDLAADDDDDDDDDDDLDDDDATPPQDDDDDDDDDDDFVVNQVSFGGQFTVTCSGDACEIDVEMSVRYWIDSGSGQINCTQIMAGSGDITLGFGSAPDFSNSTGYYEIDTDSWLDISDPAVDPDHCDPSTLDANGVDYGTAYITNPDKGYGDFNQGAIMAAGVHSALGTDYGLANPVEAGALADQYAKVGLTYAGLRFQDARLGGAAAGLSALFTTAGDGGDYFPDMILYFSPETNSEADPDTADGFIGEHSGGSLYLFAIE